MIIMTIRAIMMIVVMTAVMITFEMTILLITAEEPIQITAKKMHDTNSSKHSGQTTNHN